MAALGEHTPQVLILAGTTASGKTDVSIPLAKRLGSVIINADSRQVFRELRIGTAPPSPEQLAQVKHHFISTRSLAERWTAGDFAREARELIEEYSAQQIVPLVVGGSMLYLRALLDGLYDSGDEPVLDYKVLRTEWDSRGSEAMMAELREVDPELAEKTQSADYHRILRAIGIWRATGKRLTDLRTESATPLTQSFKLYFLFGDREETYARVNQRVDKMLAAGLVEEVRGLLEQGFDETNCNALRTHGYQEVFPYLRGDCDYETMRATIQQAVRHYVKRQLTWFRRDKRAIWVERSFAEPLEDVADRIYNDFVGHALITPKQETR